MGRIWVWRRADYHPFQIAIDKDKNIYVAASNGAFKFTNNGTYLMRYGSMDPGEEAYIAQQLGLPWIAAIMCMW